MPSRFTKDEAHAETPIHFTEDEPSRGSNEFLIEHQLGAKNRQGQGRSLFWTIVFVLGSVGTLELIVLATIIVQQISQMHPPPVLLGELNHLVPTFSTHQVLFETDPGATIANHSAEARNATRENWLAFVPRGNGFIDVNNTEKYILPPPILWEGKDTYSLAVFHQLHCLYAIMDMYNNLTSPAAEAQPDINSDPHQHIAHCFRYLRQSLMCCGDTALEGQRPNSNVSGTDGTGAMHVCKDYEAIQAWADNNRLIDKKHT